MNSNLYDQDAFYRSFVKDIRHARSRIVIESPFLTARRLRQMLPVLEQAVRRGAAVIVNTKPIDEQDERMRTASLESVHILQECGAKVLFTVGHHRKLAIIDEDILWEGSLNILSQHDSCEIMRRIKSRSVVAQATKFLGLDRFYN